jgi:hypothetical protein
MVDPETGEVDRATVLHVLRFYKVEITDPDPVEATCTLLIRESIVWSKPIPIKCGRRLIQDLKRTFDIPVHHFYRPEMMTGQSERVN